MGKWKMETQSGGLLQINYIPLLLEYKYYSFIYYSYIVILYSKLRRLCWYGLFILILVGRQIQFPLFFSFYNDLEINQSKKFKPIVAQLSYNSSLSRDPPPDNKYLSWLPSKKKTKQKKKRSVFYFTYVCMKKQNSVKHGVLNGIKCYHIYLKKSLVSPTLLISSMLSPLNNNKGSSFMKDISRTQQPVEILTLYFNKRLSRINRLPVHLNHGP